MKYYEGMKGTSFGSSLFKQYRVMSSLFHIQ